MDTPVKIYKHRYPGEKNYSDGYLGKGLITGIPQ